LGDIATFAARLDNANPVSDSGAAAAAPLPAAGIERIADVPIYAGDALVRHAAALQTTADARPPIAGLPSALWAQLGLKPGASVRVSQGAAQALLPARLDPTLAPGVVRIPAGHASTVALGAMFGAVSVEAG
jgi:NADH-quinone oxidoreductase subunit G